MLPPEYYDLKEEVLDIQSGYTLMLDDPREAYWFRMFYRPHVRHLNWRMAQIERDSTTPPPPGDREER